MRTESLVAVVLILLLFSCAYAYDAEVAASMQLPDQSLDMTAMMAEADTHVLGFDMVQRTCALFIAVRSHAWDGPISFGNDIDDSMVHWNLCPGGKKVACAPAPAAGDTTVVGIPWPYGNLSEL